VGIVLLQSTLSPYIKINGVHPDLIFVVVVGWTYLRGWEEGLGWAAIGGLSLDFISAAPFGVFTLALLLVTLAASLSHGRVFGNNIILLLALTFILGLLFNSIALLSLNLLGRPVSWIDAFSSVILPAALFNVGIMALVFPLLYLINRYLNPQPLSF